MYLAMLWTQMNHNTSIWWNAHTIVHCGKRLSLVITFEVLQLFGFGPARLLGLGVVVVGLSCVRLVLLPRTFGQQLLQRKRKNYTKLSI